MNSYSIKSFINTIKKYGINEVDVLFDPKNLLLITAKSTFVYKNHLWTMKSSKVFEKCIQTLTESNIIYKTLLCTSANRPITQNYWENYMNNRGIKYSICRQFL